MRASAWAGLVALNLGLALLVRAAAPAEPARTDRAEYEYAGRHLFAPDCPNTVYCYRVLVPALLERVPIEPRARWHAYQVTAHAAAGTLLAATVATLGLPAAAPALASLAVQASYGFAFAAYDPYTADPLVFALAALIALAWFRNWPLVALAAGVAGVFAKETVALVAAAASLAAITDRGRPHRALWIAQGVAACAVLLGFHWIMDTFAGWGIGRNAASRFSAGSWLAVWWRGTPSLAAKALLVASPFGCAWVFAGAGWRDADLRLRRLAAGTVLPMLALVYVQTPERALANAFFVVVPLAVTVLARAPLPALCALAANGAFTARMGLSSPWLPSAAVLLPVAAIVSSWAWWTIRRQARHASAGPRG